MQTEPRLQEIQSGGRLNRDVFARIVRRVEHLQEKLDGSITSRTKAAPPALREPQGKLKLTNAYLTSIILRVENFWDEAAAAGISDAGRNIEPPLNLSPSHGRLTLNNINRLIRRIEYLHGLVFGGGS